MKLKYIYSALLMSFINFGYTIEHNIPDTQHSIAISKRYAKCIAEKGKVITKHTGNHKFYEVCIFHDNRQCEIEALNSGDCKMGGIKITGFDNEAQIYCAIKGGKTKSEPNADCILPNGSKYPVNQLYYGK